MKLSNTASSYGLIAIALHWSTAILVFFLFGLGLYMTSLDYYHPWYRAAPDLHRSLGVLVITLTVIRLACRFYCLKPEPLSTWTRWEQKLSNAVHHGLYLLLIIIPISGYLISTANQQPLNVFGWFDIPALPVEIENLEDIAGSIHYFLSIGMITIVTLHAAGALKHHWHTRDNTLRRMFGLKSKPIKTSH